MQEKTIKFDKVLWLVDNRKMTFDEIAPKFGMELNEFLEVLKKKWKAPVSLEQLLAMEKDNQKRKDKGTKNIRKRGTQRKTVKKKASTSGDKKELSPKEQAEVNLKNAKNDLIKAEKRYNDKEQQIQKVAEDLSIADKQCEAFEQKIVELKKEIEHTQGKLESAKQEKNAIMNKKERLLKRLSDAEKERLEAQKNVEEAEKRLAFETTLYLLHDSYEKEIPKGKVVSSIPLQVVSTEVVILGEEDCYIDFEKISMRTMKALGYTNLDNFMKDVEFVNLYIKLSLESEIKPTILCKDERIFKILQEYYE